MRKRLSYGVSAAIVFGVMALSGMAFTAGLEASPTPLAGAMAAADPSPAAPQIWRRASYREVTIPAGTVLPLRLDTSVGSDISRIEQPVSAHLVRALVVDGTTVIPAGSAVLGHVTDARRSGKVKGRAHIAVRFSTLNVGNERYTISAAPKGWTAPATKKQDAEKIAIPAAGGAVVGAIIGGKKGAGIGALAGGGAGTAVVVSTRGKEVRLGRGAALSLRLTEPLTVRVLSS